MIFKAIVDIEINGKKRVFKFGTLSMAIFCELEKMSLKSFSDLFGKDENDESKLSPQNVLNLLYSAAAAYNRSQKIEVDFNSDDVADWMDEIGFDKAIILIGQGLSPYNPKNSAPPKENGGEVQEVIGQLKTA